MLVAVVGSRTLFVDIEKHLPENMTALISGGAEGIDQLAEQYADAHNMPKLILRPNYSLYDKAAPLVRNREIVKAAELVVAIWDGKSNGTGFTIRYAKRLGKRVEVYIIKAF